MKSHHCAQHQTNAVDIERRHSWDARGTDRRRKQRASGIRLHSPLLHSQLHVAAVARGTGSSDQASCISSAQQLQCAGMCACPAISNRISNRLLAERARKELSTDASHRTQRTGVNHVLRQESSWKMFCEDQLASGTPERVPARRNNNRTFRAVLATATASDASYWILRVVRLVALQEL